MQNGSEATGLPTKTNTADNTKKTGGYRSLEIVRFIVNSVLLGAGLAMDAFSVSVVNGMHEPGMSSGKGSP